MNELRFVFDAWAGEGTIMWVLHGIGILTLAVMIDRLLYWSSMRARFASARALRRADGQGANAILRRVAESGPRLDYLVDIAQAGRGDGDRNHVAIRVANDRLDQMDRHVGMLDWVVVVAPLLGILGTGIGMAVAFSDNTKGMPDPKMLGSGISLALRTTIWGLSISIAALTVRSILRTVRQRAYKRIKNLLRLVDHALQPKPAN